MYIYIYIYIYIYKTVVRTHTLPESALIFRKDVFEVTGHLTE